MVIATNVTLIGVLEVRMSDGGLVEVPYFQLTSGSVEMVKPRHGDGRQLDKRGWQAHNHLGPEEMGDVEAALRKRIEALSGQYDFIVGCDKPSIEMSTDLAVYKARKDET